MYTATCLLDTGSNINFVRPMYFPSQWTSRNKREKGLNFAQQPKNQPTKKVIHLHFCLNDLWSRVWCGINHSFAIDIPFGTSFIYRIIEGIYPTDRILVSWHSHLVEIPPATQRDQNTSTSTSHVAAFLREPPNEDETSSQPICIAWQTVLKPHSKPCVLVTTTNPGINTVAHRIFKRTRQKAFAAQVVTHALSSQLFPVLVA